MKRKPNESTFDYRSRVVKAGIKQKRLKRTAISQPTESISRIEKAQTTKQLLQTKKHIKQELSQLNHPQQPLAGLTLYKQAISRLKDQLNAEQKLRQEKEELILKIEERHEGLKAQLKEESKARLNLEAKVATLTKQMGQLRETKSQPNNHKNPNQISEQQTPSSASQAIGAPVSTTKEGLAETIKTYIEKLLAPLLQSLPQGQEHKMGPHPKNK